MMMSSPSRLQVNPISLPLSYDGGLGGVGGGGSVGGANDQYSSDIRRRKSNDSSLSTSMAPVKNSVDEVLWSADGFESLIHAHRFFGLAYFGFEWAQGRTGAKFRSALLNLVWFVILIFALGSSFWAWWLIYDSDPKGKTHTLIYVLYTCVTSITFLIFFNVVYYAMFGQKFAPLIHDIRRLKHFKVNFWSETDEKHLR